MTDPERLRIMIHGESAGHLIRQGEGSTFRPDVDYVENPLRPVLGQMFEDDPRAERRAHYGVPPWFANLLPEGPLRTLIARKAVVHPDRAFFLLGLLGEDLPGAVVAAVEGPEHTADESGPAGEREPLDRPLKFSLAGVQLKFSVLSGERGLTLPGSGAGGDWIVKLPDLRFEGVPESEHAMMEWARRAGIDTPETSLVAVSSIEGLPAELAEQPGLALAIRRFDRTPDGRVHIEDFAQIRGLWPQEKYDKTNYETLGRILLALVGVEAVQEFVRRLVLMIAMGNGDAHLKNWSVMYPDRRHAVLAPAYDLVPTVAFMGSDDGMALNLGRTKRFDEVRVATFQRMALKIGLDWEVLQEPTEQAVQVARDSWADVKADFAVPPRIVRYVDLRLRELPLFAGK